MYPVLAMELVYRSRVTLQVRGCKNAKTASKTARFSDSVAGKYPL